MPLAKRSRAAPVAQLRTHRANRPFSPLSCLRLNPFNKRVIILTNTHTLGAIMPNENSYEVALQKTNGIRIVFDSARACPCINNVSAY